MVSKFAENGDAQEWTVVERMRRERSNRFAKSGQRKQLN
jgi:hypothetical protein